MNKKKLLYTSLTALALASFQAKTLAEEVNADQELTLATQTVDTSQTETRTDNGDTTAVYFEEREISLELIPHSDLYHMDVVATFSSEEHRQDTEFVTLDLEVYNSENQKVDSAFTGFTTHITLDGNELNDKTTTPFSEMADGDYTVKASGQVYNKNIIYQGSASFTVANGLYKKADGDNKNNTIEEEQAEPEVVTESKPATSETTPKPVEITTEPVTTEETPKNESISKLTAATPTEETRKDDKISSQATAEKASGSALAPKSSVAGASQAVSNSSATRPETTSTTPKLPSTGEAVSLVGLLGAGMTATGVVGLKRRQK